MLQLLENLILVQSLMNVFAAGECVARIYLYCECSFAGDTASSVVVLMILCCEGKFASSTAGKRDACAFAGKCICCW